MKKKSTGALTTKFIIPVLCVLWILILAWNFGFINDMKEKLRAVVVSVDSIESNKLEIKVNPIAQNIKSTTVSNTNVVPQKVLRHQTTKPVASTPIQQGIKPMKTAQSDTSQDINDAGIHIVFSTDCTFFQDWQTIVLFHSATIVYQKGPITRIASGCKPDKQVELKELYKNLFPQYHVHFTPDFKTDGHTKKKYDFYNKPYGMKHWLENAEVPIPDGTIIALIDPDFIFLRPLQINFSQDNNRIPMKTRDNKVVPPDKFQKGHPVAQLYGLGAPWTYPNAKEFNKTEVCGVSSPCYTVTGAFGEDHFSVGPPYILEKTDFLRLTKTWTEFVPLVYKRNPDLLAEMYAYSMAAAHEDLPHATMEHFMVSNTQMHGEGWKFIDALQDDVCRPAFNGIYYPGMPLPTFLHHCQFFRVGELGFQKRRIPKSLFECDKPLLADIPEGFAKLDYKNRDGEILPLTRQQSRRNAFMICVLHRSINAAVMYYREKLCPANSISLEKSVNLAKIDY